MHDQSSPSRRDILKGSALAAATVSIGFPTIVSSRALGNDRAVTASNRIVMGCIGVGSRGQVNMNHFMSFPQVQVVAVADVDRNHLTQAKAQVEKKYTREVSKGSWFGCKDYMDFRELIARKDIDAVSICTPDHWHSVCSVAAANARKDIYCEKPLANSISEGRAVVDAARKNGCVLQTGCQERSGANSRFACELIRNGILGNVHTVRVNLPCDESYHKEVRQWNHEPQPIMPIPEALDWDKWLGPAPFVEYTHKRCHFYWRFILAHGGGEMTDRGAHVFDIVQMGLGTDLMGPIEVKAEGKRDGEGFFDAFWEYKFEFLYPGGSRMLGKADGPRGIRFEGEDGWIFIHIHGGRLEASNPDWISGKAVEAWEKQAPNNIELAGSLDPGHANQSPAGSAAKGVIRLGKSPGHHSNFLECVAGRKEPVAHAEVGHRSASICHLANIAMTIGKQFKWDPHREQTDDAAANTLLSHTMRPPWTL